MENWCVFSVLQWISCIIIACTTQYSDYQSALLLNHFIKFMTLSKLIKYTAWWNLWPFMKGWKWGSNSLCVLFCTWPLWTSSACLVALHSFVVWTICGSVSLSTRSFYLNSRFRSFFFFRVTENMKGHLMVRYDFKGMRYVAQE